MAKTVPPFLRGRKGAGSYKNTPDTIRSEDTIEVILGVGEGKNFGLADGAKSFRAGGTALVSSNNEANFGDFVLKEYTGLPNAPAIVPVLGGLGSPTPANASNLASATPVVRTGSLTQIDYIDMRFLVNQLQRSDKKGVYTDNLRILIEYRQSVPAGQPWVLAWSTVVPPPPGYDEDTTAPGVNSYTGGTTGSDFLDGVVTFRGDDVYMRSEAIPGEPIGNLPNIWLNPAQQGKPHIYEGGQWIPAPGVVDDGGHWTYTTGGSKPTSTTFYKNPTSAPANPAVGAVWTPPGGTPQRFNGTSWVVPLIGSVANAAYAQPMLGTPDGVLSIVEKITSPTVREVRIPVPRVDVPYDLRVTKLTPDSNLDATQVSAVGWESFEEIIAEGRSFPNTHVLHLVARASDQFNSLPELDGDVKGRIIQVPTNYDPVTRTYAGIWDGLFKEAWTDNGAWCTRDFIRNDRYGLSTLYPLEVKEASFYAWAQWCDYAVPDNKGGSRPRWTYNDSLDQPRQAKEQANYMAGSSGGRLIDDGSGIYDVLIDRDEPLSMIFGPESVVDGEFVYSFSDVQTRANWIKVGFMNPDLDWQVDYRLVKDDDHIAEYGRIPMEFVATGKTNVSEALAAARLRLITGTTEYTAVTFRTNRIGKYLWPFKNVGIVDPDMGWGVSGRISEKTGARQVRLRDSVFLEAGISYKFVFNRPTVPMTTVTMIVTPGQTGSLKIINFTADLPADLPEFAQFSLESYNASTSAPIGLAKAFRILTITPADGDSDIVEITALEVNRNKSAFVDGTGELLPAEEYTNFDGPITRPLNVTVTPTLATAGGLTRRNLQIEWDQPVNPFARNTLVEYSRDGNVFVQVGESRSEFFEVEDVISGSHAIRLTHVHDDGIRKSQPVMVVHEITSNYRFVPPPATLVMADEAEPLIFESTSPMFRWQHGDEDPNFKSYRVRVLTPGNVVKRTEDISLKEFIYDFDKNKTDHAGTPARAFTISVTKVDDFGSESAPLELDVANLAPATPAFEVRTTFDGFEVQIDPPVNRDVIGAMVWVSTTNGFNPIGVAPTYEGNQQVFPVTRPELGEVYVRVAYYDAFGKTGLNISGQQTTRTTQETNAVAGIFRSNFGFDADIAAAELAAYQSEQSRTASELARDAADLHEYNAGLARDAAGQARDLAQGAQSGAQTALQLAQGQVTLSNTARDLAQQAQAAALQQAQAASGSAGIASGHADTAEDRRDEAAGWASSAQGHAQVARATTAQTFPSSMLNPGFWTTQESILEPVPLAVGDSHFQTTEVGPVFINEPGETYALAPVGMFVPKVGSTYRVTAHFRLNTAPVGGGDVANFLGFCIVKTDGSIIWDAPQVVRTSAQVGQYVEVHHDWLCDGTIPIKFARPRFHINWNGSAAAGAKIEIHAMSFADITESKKAEFHASASNTSASTAFAKATEAGSEAAAANQSRIDANTAKGQAFLARDEAVSAKETAQGVITTVTDIKNAATQAKNDADGFAQAAFGHANTASTKANEAGISATAASASYIQARAVLGQVPTIAPGATPGAFAVDQWSLLSPTPNVIEIMAETNSRLTVANNALRLNGSHAVHVHPVKATKVEAGRRYRVTTSYRRSEDGANPANVTTFIWTWDVNGNVKNIHSYDQEDITVGSGTRTTDKVLGIAGLADINLVIDADVVWIRPMVRIIQSNGKTDWLGMGVADVSSELASKGFALAAAESYSAADSRADAAEQAASATSGDRVAAQTAKSLAESARDLSVGARDTAFEHRAASLLSEQNSASTASQAGAARDAAMSAAQSRIPGNMSPPQAFCGSDQDNPPTSIYGATDGRFYTNAQGAKVFANNAGETLIIAPVATFQPIVDHTYRGYLRIRKIAEAYNRPSSIHFALTGRNAAGAPLYQGGSSRNGATQVPWTWETYTFDWKCTAADQIGFLRPRVHLNWDDAGSGTYSTGRYEIGGFDVVDITSQLAADGSATAANERMQTATSKADAAGLSATAAELSRQSADASARFTLPGTFAQGVTHFTNDTNRNALDTPPTNAVLNANLTLESESGVGRYYRGYTGDQNLPIATKGYATLLAGRMHQVRVRARVAVSGQRPTYVIYGFAAFNGSGAFLGDYWLEFHLISAAQGWKLLGRTNDQGVSICATTEQIATNFPGATYIRPKVLVNWADGNNNGGTFWSGAYTDIASIQYEDITATEQAKGFASAASESYSLANSRATDAGNAASAASGHKDTANTARGQAEAFRNQASDFRDEAEGFKGTASTASGVAVSAKDAARQALQKDFPDDVSFRDIWSYEEGPVSINTALHSADKFGTSDLDGIPIFHAPTGNTLLTTRQTFSPVPGRKYRLTVVARRRGGNGDAALWAGFCVTHTHGGSEFLGQDSVSFNTKGVGSDTFATWKGEWVCPAGAFYHNARPRVHIDYGNTGTRIEVKSFLFEDVSESSAAAGSASEASVQRGLAGDHAQAASGFKADAETALTQARGARDIAVSARDSSRLYMQNIVPTNMGVPSAFAYDDGNGLPYTDADGHFTSNGEGTKVFRNAAYEQVVVAAMATFNAKVGNTYRMYVNIRKIAEKDGTVSVHYFGFTGKNAAGTITGHHRGYDAGANLPWQWTTLTHEWTVLEGQQGPYRPRIHLNWNNAGTQVAMSAARYEVASLVVEDVTSEKAAGESFSKAQEVATLSARFAGGLLNDNANFGRTEAWNGQGGTAGIPIGWADWTYGWRGVVKQAPGIDGSPYGYLVNLPDGAESQGIYQDIPNVSKGWYVAEWNLSMPWGGNAGQGFRGMCMHVEAQDVNGNAIAGAYDDMHLFTTVPLSDEAAGSGAGDGRVYRFSQLMFLDHSSIRKIRIYVMNRWLYGAGFLSGMGGTQTITYKAGLRPASPNEIETRKARGGAATLSAKFESVSTTFANADIALAGRIEKWEAKSESANLLRKAVFKGDQAIAPWGTFSNDPNGNFHFVVRGNDHYSISNEERSLEAHQGDVEQGWVYDFNCQTNIVGGKRYCASVYSGAHRAELEIFIDWYRTDGSNCGSSWNLPNSSGNTRNNEEQAGGGGLANYKRIFVFADAPGDAARGTMVLRKHGTNPNAAGTPNPNSYAFWTRPMFSEAKASDTQPPTWQGAAVEALLNETTQVAANANGIARASRSLVLNVNGYISGTRTENDGTTSTFDVLADTFRIFAPGGGARTEFYNGLWYAYSADNTVRSVWGRPFGGDHALTWWTGSNYTAYGDERKNNAFVYISMNTTGGGRFGGSDVPGATVPFTVSVPGGKSKTVVGGSGTITTDALSTSVSGNTGSVSWSWNNVFGDPSVGVGGTSSPTFSADPGTVGAKQAIFAYTATDAGTGQSRYGQVAVTIQRDA